MSDAPVRVEVRDDGIAVITLDRQDKLNALNESVRQRLMEAVDALADDDRVKVGRPRLNQSVQTAITRLCRQVTPKMVDKIRDYLAK